MPIMPTGLEEFQHMGQCRGREMILKSLKYSGKFRVDVTVRLCTTVGNLGSLCVSSFRVFKCYWKRCARRYFRRHRFVIARCKPFLADTLSVNWFKYPLVLHYIKVIVKNKAWPQKPWLFSSENSCLASVSVVHYYVSVQGLICLQHSHECFVQSKSSLTRYNSTFLFF